MRKALKANGKKRYVLKLYVTGATRRSQKAITNLNSICEEYLQGRYDLQVVDIYQSPVLAKDADILAAPTLVKQLPLPVRRLIGDLSERGRVLVLLDVKPKASSNDQDSSNKK
jgi:circadian clock protein KaiB